MVHVQGSTVFLSTFGANETVFSVASFSDLRVRCPQISPSDEHDFSISFIFTFDLSIFAFNLFIIIDSFVVHGTKISDSYPLRLCQFFTSLDIEFTTDVVCVVDYEELALYLALNYTRD